VRGGAIYVGLFAAAIALALLAPDLDVATSRLFYDPQYGFHLGDWLPLRLVEGSVPWIVRLLVIGAVIAAGWLWLRGRAVWRLDGKALLFLVAAMALGPGLLANTVLKDHWGRARPSQIEEFGGARQFTPAPLPAAQCERNCSFVSGHAALGFSLVAFAFLLPPGRDRTTAIAAALGFGALVGLGRMAAGRHFLSDVAFAGLLMFGVTWLLHRWIVVQDGLTKIYEGLVRQPRRRLWLWLAVVAGIEIAALGWLDRLAAEFFRAQTGVLRGFFVAVEPFGRAYPYVALCILGYVVLRWGSLVPVLRRCAEPMRAATRVPVLVFAGVAVSGITVDLLKVIFGRPRPKLLFGGHTYDFSWLGTHADYWSFPSGHAATAAAVVTALWCLWPRPLPFYVIAAALVAASRVVTGAHYPGDVVMGAFLGVVLTRLLAGMILPSRVRVALPVRAPALPQT